MQSSSRWQYVPESCHSLGEEHRLPIRRQILEPGEAGHVGEFAAVARAADGIRDARAAMKGPPPQMPGPTRAQLLDVMRE